MSLYIGTITLEGSPLRGTNPQPFFRDKIKNREFASDGTLTDEEKINWGYETGFRVLPYRMQDRYNRVRETMTLKTVTLENDKLKAVFLTEYGGRLYSLFNKVTGRELLFKNPVFQPANLAIRNAWFSGGIEWNIAQLGHTFSTASPVFFAKVLGEDDEVFLRLYDYEREKNIFWQIDFHLREGSEHLEAYVRIINDNNYSVPMYWWTNIAVPETKKTRVFSGTKEVYYIHPKKKEDKLFTYGHGQLPKVSAISERDISYPSDISFASEYFFQNGKEQVSPWEGVIYEDGHLFYERSTQPLRTRKMFCWGNHKGGNRWKDFLANEGEGAYVEIQAGLTPSQLHGLDMPRETVWDFTQIFGCLEKVSSDLYETNWEKASNSALQEINKKLDTQKVLESHRKNKKCAQYPPLEILSLGTGYGALESIRRQKVQDKPIPEGLIFPKESLNEEQRDWLNLLEKGYIEEKDYKSIPASWMTHINWLEEVKQSTKVKKGNHYLTWLHLGNILYENDDYEEGIAAWKKSNELCENPWATRNLGYAAWQEGHEKEYLEKLKRAYQLEENSIDVSFAEEAVQALIRVKDYKGAWKLYQTIPEKYHSERLLLYVADAAVKLEHFDFVEPLFEKEFAVIREGEETLCNIWFEYKARKYAKLHSIPYTEKILRQIEIEKTTEVPYILDLRSFT